MVSSVFASQVISMESESGRSWIIRPGGVAGARMSEASKTRSKGPLMSMFRAEADQMASISIQTLTLWTRSVAVLEWSYSLSISTMSVMTPSGSVAESVPPKWEVAYTGVPSSVTFNSAPSRGDSRPSSQTLMFR